MNDSMLTAVVDDLQVLLNSRKFREWKPRIVHRKPVDQTAPVIEKHYSPAELAKAWGVSSETVRCIFRREPGVLRIPSGRENNNQRSYVTMKIPESVAARVHRRLTAIPK